MELTDQLVGGGTSNRGDFYQASTVFQQARADVALLTAAIAQDRNALELLAGSPIADDLLPVALPEELDWFADVPVGMSSQVLLERPDVLAAEHELMAANANIGAARAAFFPRISLTANAGSASTELSGLFKSGTWALTGSASLLQPIFDAGRNQANLDVAKVNKDIAIAQYEKAIQTAFREVSDSLAGRATLGEQLRAQAAVANAAQVGFNLADLRYRNGVASYFDVLDAQRSLFTAQQATVQVQAAQVQNLVTLYKVLGGGWTEPRTAN